MNKKEYTESIFKDSAEDVAFNKEYKRKNPYEKEMRMVKISLLSIVGAILIILYFSLFFTKVYKVLNEQYAKVKESKDKVAYTLSRFGFNEVIIVKGRPNDSKEAFITGEFSSGKDINYRVVFSDPNNWNDSYISMYDEENVLIYQNQYENSYIKITPDNFFNSMHIRVYVNDDMATLEDLYNEELIGLSLRREVRFRGNMISFYIIIVLLALELYSIFFWEKSFDRWISRYTYNSSNAVPSDFYEFRVRIGQLIVGILIVIELFRAFTY